jgi:LAO/AO transport system kinase
VVERPTRTGRPVDVAALVTAARAGSPRAVARLISLVEDAHPALREVMAALAPHTGHARVIGVTGSPGVGKSTSTTAVVAAYRRRGCRVGILAVDPSSPFSGGALLGDRIRMQDHVLDPEVSIRSMASRGHLGGLSWTTPQALRVLDAAGCDVVVLETVGVGQSEVEVAGLADTTLVLLAPGMGDGVQAAKAGILEIGDVFVVNKADREGADATVRDLRHMISLGDRTQPGLWRPPVVKTVASRGEGVDDVMAALDHHLEWLERTGTLRTRRVARAEDEIEAIALTALRSRIGSLRHGEGVRGLAESVVDGHTDPYAAADHVVDALTGVVVGAVGPLSREAGAPAARRAEERPNSYDDLARQRCRPDPRRPTSADRR